MNAQPQIDLWEIWIEYDQYNPDYFGTLYVHGEIETTKTAGLRLVRMGPADSHQLILQLPDATPCVYQTSEVMYSLPVKNLNQYTSVSIYAGNELIGQFNDIEIMI